MRGMIGRVGEKCRIPEMSFIIIKWWAVDNNFKQFCRNIVLTIKCLMNFYTLCLLAFCLKAATASESCGMRVTVYLPMGLLIVRGTCK